MPSSMSKPLYKFPLAAVNKLPQTQGYSHTHSLFINTGEESEVQNWFQQAKLMVGTVQRRICVLAFFQTIELHSKHFVAHGSFYPLYSEDPS